MNDDDNIYTDFLRELRAWTVHSADTKTMDRNALRLLFEEHRIRPDLTARLDVIDDGELIEELRELDMTLSFLGRIESREGRERYKL